MLVRKALGESRFNNDTLFVANTLKEASKFAARNIGLLLVDVALPDSDGLDVLNKISDIYPTTCLIVLTGSIDDDVALAAVRQGAQNFLGKDELNGRVLNRTILLSLERHQMVQKLRTTERELLQSKRLLEYSEARLLEAQSAAKVGSWETDLTTMNVFWSTETFHIFDLDERSYKPTHSSFLEHVHPRDKSRVDEAFRNSFLHSEINTIEHRIITKKGIEKWVFEWWRVYHDTADRPMRAAGTCQDITERKLAEAKIQLSESRLLRAQTIGKLGYWQIDLETDTVWASKEAMRIYGFPPVEGELTRAQVNEYVIDKEIVSQATTNLIEFGKEYNIEFRIRQVDGPGIKNIHAIAELERDEFGEPCRIVGSLQDITDRKQAEEQIRIEKYFSEALINSLPGIFYLYDQDGRFTRWNKNLESISGYSAEEISLMHPLDFYDGEEKKLVKHKIERVFADGDEEVNAHFYTKDKRKIPYYFNGHRISFQGNDYLIGVGIDITARSRAEQELLAYTQEIKKLTAHLEQVREEERTRIAREIHDELGQQLTGLKMDASWLLKKIGKDQTALHEKLESMISLMDHTVRTIRKISSDLRPGILDDLGLIAALEWQSNEFEKRAEIECVFTSDVEDTDFDKNINTCIFRIYQEALTNVMRHSSATRVEARMQRISDGFVLIVTDNGIGFDLQEKKETLGLIGMRERALMIGGNFTIESEKGRGVSVQLKIPEVAKNTTL